MLKVYFDHLCIFVGKRPLRHHLAFDNKCFTIKEWKSDWIALKTNLVLNFHWNKSGSQF